VRIARVTRSRTGTVGLLPLALTYLTAAFVAGVAVAATLVGAGPLGHILVAYAYPFLAALYAGTGLLAWWRRPGNRLGPLLLFGGAAWLLGSLQNTGVPTLIGVGLIFASVPLAVVVHLVHACPSGRLRNRAARWTVGAAYFVALVLQAPLWAFTPQPPPFDAVLISPRPDLALDWYHVQQWCGAAVVAVSVWQLVRRLRDYDRSQRRLLAPLFAYTLVALLSIPIGSNFLQPEIGIKRTIALQVVTLAGVTLGFALVVLRGGFARTRELGAFVTSVTSADGPHEGLQDAVARTLGDPFATVLRWSPDRGTYVDGMDAPADVATTDHVATVPIELGARHLGTLVYDAQLTVDPALPTAVARVVAIALDRERLAQQAAAGERALQEASLRLLGESDRTRRRIAQDLHDGVQVSLVTLSMQAHRIAEEAEGLAVGELAEQLALDVDRAAGSLRALVQGVMPPQLVERGLAAAVQELVYNVPLRVRLDIDEALADLPAPVESTAYFVVAEALTNAVKHADADKVEVSLELAEGALHISICDDGRGGAHSNGTGLGLPGMRDRLQMLGGTLQLTSGPEGTRLDARLPCA
jgi:signal transduction histidine kinase